MITKSRMTTSALLAAALWVGAMPVLAQTVPGMNGRANDANNQIGSGGLNNPVPSYFNTSNLYITGNVTRGSHFRANSPIRDSNALFLSLPSSTLSSFQRDTMGVSTVVNNPAPWRSTPFYDPSRTVVGVGAIQAGQNLPGSSVPSTTYLVPRPFDAAGLGSAPIDVTYGMQATVPVVPNSSIYTPLNTAALRSGNLYDRLRLTQETNALHQSPVFGRTEVTTRGLTPSASGVNAVMQDPYALDLAATRRLQTDPIVRQSRTALEDGARPTSEQMLIASPELLSPSALAPKLFRPLEQEEPARDALTGRVLSNQRLPGESRYLAVQRDPGTSIPLNPGPLPPPGAGWAQAPSATSQTIAYGGAEPGRNPLLDLASAVALIREFDASAPAPEQPAATPTVREQYERAMSIVRDASNQPVRTLAGTSQSRIDALMRQAEEKVRTGDYYQASTLYELAASMDPENPLIRLGHANSLAAAGEYITAVYQLGAAIEAYPAFGFLQLDLNEFVRDPEDLDLRRADLERRLEREEDYRLRFLLGYIEQYSGFKKFAKPNLHQAASEAPPDSFIARFPDILESRNKYLPNIPTELDGEVDANTDK